MADFKTPNLCGANPELNNALSKLDDLKKSELVDNQEPHSEKRLWYNWAPSDLVNLGLDLRGGAHVLVEVNLEDVYSERIQNFWPEIRNTLRNFRKEIGSFTQIISPEGDSLIIKFNNKSKIDDAISILSNEITSKKNIINFSIFEEDSIKEKYVLCNNCDIVHKVFEINKSEIKWGNEGFKSLVTTKEDIKFNLENLGMERLVTILEVNNVDISDWELIDYLLENDLEGKVVIDKKEIEDSINYKYLEIKNGS